MAGFEFYPACRAISWLNWTTNLALVEYWIRRKRTLTLRDAGFVPA